MSKLIVKERLIENIPDFVCELSDMTKERLGDYFRKKYFIEWVGNIFGGSLELP